MKWVGRNAGSSISQPTSHGNWGRIRRLPVVVCFFPFPFLRTRSFQPRYQAGSLSPGSPGSAPIPFPWDRSSFAHCAKSPHPFFLLLHATLQTHHQTPTPTTVTRSCDHTRKRPRFHDPQTRDERIDEYTRTRNRKRDRQLSTDPLHSVSNSKTVRREKSDNKQSEAAIAELSPPGARTRQPRFPSHSVCKSPPRPIFCANARKHHIRPVSSTPGVK
ncbi:hypothetical protein BDP55DRAFT_336879 [Colletotrichum godetiae]|uniref:Uncharacterized protein n=1 Tax=Colletotrichum godetiae TaxID=1209918 RepID=A0AAJ0AAQ8_9PEZI|nr:uncharacterized protein BDP55DRAFT_336879 [Colletotrichum godetiae]KAK1659675.1 hypothetical protein BDP55DRAFT_336879 [Colletotrichum godetiae]